MQSEFNRVVIVDTTCFILLDKIGELSILQKAFGSVATTDIIAKEFGKPFPDWVNILSVSNQHYLHLLQSEVDEVEASAIALSLEHERTLLILDDWKARRLATKLSLDFTGTLGVLLNAKSLGLLSEVKSIVLKIQETNFRFSEEIKNEILKKAGEK